MGGRNTALLGPIQGRITRINIYIIKIRFTIPHPPHRGEVAVTGLCEFPHWGIGGTVLHPRQKSLVYGGEVGVSTGEYSTS